MWKDRISNLPDEILVKILSDLPTKHSVRTGVLSKRWMNLWLHVPTLDLHYKDFKDDDETYVDFINRFLLKSDRGVGLNVFKLAYDVDGHRNSVFESWISAAVKRGARYLTVENDVDNSEAWEVVRLPLSIYSCATLVSLALYRLHFDENRKSFSFPCLEIMHLEMVMYPDELTLETLISSCESLRELTIIRDETDLLDAITVRSGSLRRLTFKFVANERLNLAYIVEIDAPRLEYLSLIDNNTDDLVIHNRIAPCAQVCIDVNFGVGFDESLDTDDSTVTTMVGEFLTAISDVRDMTISFETIEVMYAYYSVETLPQFANLHSLHTTFYVSSLEFLPNLLQCCPKLHSLALDFHQRSVITKTEPINLPINIPTVPQCFKSSLEFVQMATPFTFTDTSSKLKLATYFVRNCVVLKELKLSVSFCPVLARIKRIPKRSRGCKILIGARSTDISNNLYLLQGMFPSPTDM